MQSRNDNRAVLMNMVWAILAVGLNYAINFTITPYITNNIGVEAYGFVSLANTFTSYIDIISIALNAFAARYISIAYHKGKYAEANAYFNSVIIANLILAITVLIPCVCIIYKLEIFLNIPDSLVSDVKILFLVVLLKYFVTILRTAFDVGTFIKNRLDLSERQKAISYLIQGLLLLGLCLALKPHVWYVGVATFVAACYLLVVNYRYVKVLTPELRIAPHAFSKKKVTDLVSSGIWNAINNLGNVLNSGLDLIISNLMLTATVMGQVSIAKSLATICYTLVTTIASSFKPMQTKDYANGDTRKLVKDLKSAMKITGLCCNILIAGFFSYGVCFLNLWLKTDNIDFIYKLSMIVLLSDIVIGVVNPLYYVFTLTDKLRIPCIITIIMGLLNISSMYLLIRFTSTGAYAVVLTTLVLNFVHFFDTPIYSAYCLKVRSSTFYPVVVRHLISCVINVIVVKVLSKFLFVADSWIWLFIDCVIAGGTAAIIGAFIYFDREELFEICSKVKSKVKLKK